MTTSPEALREATSRLTEFESLSVETGAGYALLHVYGNEEDGPPAVFGLSADLKAVLSALQEAREALGPFASAWDRSNPAAPYSTSPRIFPAIADFRRAAEVYRALSPGGAE